MFTLATPTLAVPLAAESASRGVAPVPWTASVLVGATEPGPGSCEKDTAADPTPDEFVALREAAHRAASAARTSSQWSAPARTAALSLMDTLAGVLATARGSLLLAERDAGTSKGVGDKDFVAARARITRAGLGAVHREVRQAQTLADLPTVATAVAGGRVPVGHVDALARVVAAAGPEASSMLSSPEGQAELVDWGSRLPEREFATRVAQLVATHDPESVQASFDAQHAARYFTWSATADGVLLKGRLDRVAGERLRVALDATGIGPDEHRDPLQARADALVAVAERSLSGQAGVKPRRRRARPGETAAQTADLDAAHAAAQEVADRVVSGSSNRPHVSLLIPADTFAAFQRHHQELHEDRPSNGHSSDTARPEPARSWTGLGPATLEDGSPVAASELARVLCDAQLSRIVLSAEGLPLNLGRSVRLYSGNHRRAVIVRDRGCAWNGCTTNAAYCEVHHIRWWRRDQGPTSLDNGVLLCNFHHHLVHRLDLTIERHLPAGRRAPGLSPSPGSGRGGVGDQPQRRAAGIWGGHEPPRYTFRHRRNSAVENEPERNETERNETQGDETQRDETRRNAVPGPGHSSPARP